MFTEYMVEAMTENKRYFKREWEEEYYIFDSTEISEEKVDEEIEYGYEIFADSMQGDKVVNKLNEQDERIKELTTQLQTEEESVCIKCKHHYLTKKDPLHDAISNGETVPFSSPLINIEPYYISKCKKGHVECSKEDIRYCEDFKLSGDTHD